MLGCKQSDKNLNSAEPVNNPKTAEEEPKCFCAFDGMIVTDSQSLNRRPLLVSIENHPSARPQSGLNQACLVYEFLAEGNITRFLALYLHNEPQTIGPIRSARPYFLDKAMELDAIYAHCGQSPQAELEIPKFQIKSINEIGGAGAYFWRDATRKKPHNLYSSVQKLRQYAAQKGWGKKVEVKGFDFSAASQPVGKTTKKILIDYPGKYEVVYIFDQGKEVYLRNMEGKPHLDRETGEQLTAKNVVVLYANKVKVLDSEGRLEIDLLSQGKAVYFIGDQKIEGNWKKTERSSPTYFFDQEEKEIQFKPGQIWIQIVAPTTGLVVE